MLIGLLSGLVRWSVLMCVPGGVLWALSPLGIYLSEYKYKTPEVFWKLFPFCVLLLMVGLAGLYVRRAGDHGWLGKAGFSAAFLGLILVLVGDVGKYWLGVDNTYIMTAPAYYAFRAGLIMLAIGSIVFGFAALRDGTLPHWTVLPFVLGAWGGLISFSGDLGYFGATLWILFGAGWAWLGLSLLVEAVAAAWTYRRKKRVG